jgi:DNA-binding beta-propeller fold protein YncE
MVVLEVSDLSSTRKRLLQTAIPPPDGEPFGLAIDPAGKFAFVTNVFSNSVSAYGRAYDRPMLDQCVVYENFGSAS